MLGMPSRPAESTNSAGRRRADGSAQLVIACDEIIRRSAVTGCRVCARSAGGYKRVVQLPIMEVTPMTEMMFRVDDTEATTPQLW